MINEISDLKKLLKLLREQGVTDFEFDKIKIKLGEKPQSQTIDESKLLEDQTDDMVGLPDDIPGVDPMAFYASPSRVDQ